jgi:hypothetical protein
MTLPMAALPASLKEGRYALATGSTADTDRLSDRSLTRPAPWRAVRTAAGSAAKKRITITGSLIQNVASASYS